MNLAATWFRITDLVPDGSFFGWPYSYYANIWTNVCSLSDPTGRQGRVPDYALGRTLLHSPGFFQAAMASALRQRVFIGQHVPGTAIHQWLPVIFVPFREGKALREPIDVLTGLLAPMAMRSGGP